MTLTSISRLLLLTCSLLLIASCSDSGQSADSNLVQTSNDLEPETNILPPAPLASETLAPESPASEPPVVPQEDVALQVDSAAEEVPVAIVEPAFNNIPPRPENEQPMGSSLAYATFDYS